MPTASTLLAEARKALKAKSTETGERNAVVRVLAKHGAYSTPKIEKGHFPSSGQRGASTLRVYIWSTDWGTLVLTTGPSIEGELQWAKDSNVTKAPKGFYHVLDKATGTSKITASMKRIAGRQQITGETRVTRPKRKKKAAPKKAARKPYEKAAPKLSPTKFDERVLLAMRLKGGTTTDLSQRLGLSTGNISKALRSLEQDKLVRHLEITGSEDKEWTWMWVITDKGLKWLREEEISEEKPAPALRLVDSTDVVLGRAEEAEIEAAIGREQAGINALNAAETKAHSLVNMFKEQGNAGYLQDVLKMYHGNDEYESRAATSEINDFAQYAVPGVRIQESMNIFAHAAHGELSDDKIVSYYAENRADIDKAPSWVAARLVEDEVVEEREDRRQLVKLLQGPKGTSSRGAWQSFGPGSLESIEWKWIRKGERVSKRRPEKGRAELQYRGSYTVYGGHGETIVSVKGKIDFERPASQITEDEIHGAVTDDISAYLDESPEDWQPDWWFPEDEVIEEEGDAYESAEEIAVHPDPIMRAVLRHEERVRRGEVVDEEIIEEEPEPAKKGVWEKRKHEYYYLDPETREVLAPEVEDIRKSTGSGSAYRYAVVIAGASERFEKLREAKAYAIANAYTWHAAPEPEPEPETMSEADELAEMMAMLKVSIDAAR